MILSFSKKPRPAPKAGDIIGFSGDSWLSVGINLATYGIPFWSLSHVGIVGEHDGELLLFESTSLSDLPCVIQGKPVWGTQAHRIDECVRTYGGKVWHYPLYRPLYPFESKRLSEFLLEYIGKDYDAIGAFRAGGIGWSWLEGIRFAHTVGRNDVSFLEWACSTRRGAGVTVLGGRHMICLVHLDEKWAGILDNNDTSRIRWVPRKTFLAEWFNSNSWATTPVYSPAPPLPYWRDR